MILLMLHLIHIKCLKIQYFQSNLEHEDGSQFQFTYELFERIYIITLHKNIVLEESNVYNRAYRCLN